MLINIPAGTEVEMNGIPVSFPKATNVEFPCETIAHASELCHAAKLKIDLSYTAEEDGKQWRYYAGAGGKMFRTEVVKEIQPTKAKPKKK